MMKFVNILFLLLGISSFSYSQSMVIHYTDGEKSSIKTEDVESITISEKSSSELKKSLSDSLEVLQTKVAELEKALTDSEKKNTETKNVLTDSLSRLNSIVAELENSPIELAHGRYYNLNTKNCISSTDKILIEDDNNETMFSKSALKISVKDIASKENTNHSNSYRGYIDFSMPSIEKINKSLSFWVKIPSKYQADDRIGTPSEVSCAIINVSLYQGNEKKYTKDIYGEYAFTSGWMLYKFIDEKSLGVTFDKIRISIKTFDEHPNMYFWIDSFVIDQMAKPTLLLSFDNDFANERSDFLQYLYDNKIPFSATAGLNNSLYQQAYKDGIVDIGIYNGDAKSKRTIKDIHTYLSEKTNKEVYNHDFFDKKVETILSSTNYVNDKLLEAQIGMGFNIIRASNAYNYSSYIGGKVRVVKTSGFGGIKKGQVVDEKYINDQIEYGKKYIDELIKFGCIGGHMNHYVVKYEDLKDNDYGLAGVYEVVTRVIDYALEKQKEGKLRIMNFASLYHNSIN